jgi:uncharacterized protein YkwD
LSIFVLAALAALAAALALAGAGGDHAGDGGARRTAGAITDRTNGARAQQGLPPLTLDPALTRAAGAYARELARSGVLDHNGPGGSTVDTRAAAHGYDDWTFLGENLATGSGAPDAAALVEAWLRSPEHRRNLLSPDLSEFGAGCYVISGAGPRYWCALELGARGQ